MYGATKPPHNTEYLSSVALPFLLPSDLSCVSGAVALVTHRCRDTQLFPELALSQGPLRSGAGDGEIFLTAAMQSGAPVLRFWLSSSELTWKGWVSC